MEKNVNRILKNSIGVSEMVKMVPGKIILKIEEYFFKDRREEKKMEAF